MPTRPIGDRAMTAGERSARNQAKIRQEFNRIRIILKDNAALFLRNGKLFANEGQQTAAHEAYKQAEICTNQINNINKRLERYEHEFTDWASPPPPRKGFEVPDPREGLVFAELTLSDGERKQADYAAQRAARRPDIDARYGHLAKAEKAAAHE